MRTAFLLLAALALLALPPALRGQGARITSVEPDAGKMGDTIGAAGEAIDKANVVELYLTDGANDMKVAILQQTDKLITFKIPGGVKAGRYNLMIKTTGAQPKLLEQPVKLQVQ